MKMMKVLVALLVVAGLAVPAIVVAEDRLSLSGEMRVRGWATDRSVDDAEDETASFGDQRLRIGGKIAVAEGVSVTFRTDVTETEWGAGGSDFGAGRMGGTQQWDRAHLDLQKGIFHLRAGQQYVGFGRTFAVDTQEAGLLLNVNGALPVTAFALLDDQNGGHDNADAFLYGIGVKPRIGLNIALDLFAANQVKRFNAQEDVYVIGAALGFLFDPVDIIAELDFFTGDFDDNTDAMGTQFLLEASMNATQALKVGAQFYYADAADDDEVQYVNLGNGFNGYDPIMDVGTSLSNEVIPFGRPFDFSGDNAGVIGGRLFATSKLTDSFNLGASVAFLETEDDDISDVDAMAFAAGMTYAVMANTSLQAQVQYTDGEANGVDFDDTEAGIGLFVNF